VILCLGLHLPDQDILLPSLYDQHMAFLLQLIDLATGDLQYRE
jgi:hypothetical protein